MISKWTTGWPMRASFPRRRGACGDKTYAGPAVRAGTRRGGRRCAGPPRVVRWAFRGSREETGMREDIEFDAEGATLRGWFYRPDDATGDVPCVVMAHGFSAIKEMHLDEYADVFSTAGLACVVFDNRGFG